MTADRPRRTNPVAAGLVDKHEDWPGLAMWFGEGETKRTFRRFRRRAWDTACRKAGQEVPKDDFYDYATLELVPPEGIDEARE